MAGIRVLAYNIRGIAENQREEKQHRISQHLVGANGYQIGVIGETWLKPTTTDEDVTVPRFQMERQDRVGIEHGGLLVHIRNDVQYTRVAKVQLESNLQFIHIEITKPSKFHLVAIYLPKTNKNVFQLMRFYAQVLNGRSTVFIGDINADPIRDAILFHMLPNQFNTRIDDSTRGQSCIDHVITNIPELPAGVLDQEDISDHKPIWCSVPQREVQGEEATVIFPTLDEVEVDGGIGLHNWVDQNVGRGQCQINVWYDIHKVLSTGEVGEQRVNFFISIGRTNDISKQLKILRRKFESMRLTGICGKKCVALVRYDGVTDCLQTTFLCRYFICDQAGCFRLFADKNPWLTHCKTAHRIDYATLFHCANTACQGLAVEHEEEHHYCSQCPTKNRQFFVNAIRIVQHKRLFHSPSSKICPTCFRHFVYGKSFQNHVAECKSGGQSRPFRCRVCSKSYKCEGWLKRHQRLHQHF